jgi:hypothetical protein
VFCSAACALALVIFCWQIWSLDVDVFSFFPPSTLKLVQFEQSECSDCRGGVAELERSTGPWSHSRVLRGFFAKLDGISPAFAG